jgi:ankyrin repeat protein
VSRSAARHPQPAANRRSRGVPAQASRSGRLDAARYLIDAGADLHAGDDDGAQPLPAASAAGHLAVVDLLLARGAAPAPIANAGQYKSCTPSEVACSDAGAASPETRAAIVQSLRRAGGGRR